MVTKLEHNKDYIDVLCATRFKADLKSGLILERVLSFTKAISIREFFKRGVYYIKYRPKRLTFLILLGDKARRDLFFSEDSKKIIKQYKEFLKK